MRRLRPDPLWWRTLVALTSLVLTAGGTLGLVQVEWVRIDLSSSKAEVVPLIAGAVLIGAMVAVSGFLVWKAILFFVLCRQVKYFFDVSAIRKHYRSRMTLPLNEVVLREVFFRAVSSSLQFPKDLLFEWKMSGTAVANESLPFFDIVCATDQSKAGLGEPRFSAIYPGGAALVVLLL